MERLSAEQIRRFAERHIRDSSRLSREQCEEALEYGAIVPGVTCPQCGGELLHTSNGALCESCTSYVPVVGTAVVLDVEAEDDSDWTDDEDVS